MKNLIQTIQKTNSVPRTGIRIRLRSTVLLFGFLFILGGFANAQLTITSVQSGPWNDPNTWDESVIPTSADDVIITGGLEVYIDVTGAECNTLQVGDINNSGLLTFLGTSSLTVNGAVTMGNLDGATYGVITMDDGAVLTCSSIEEGDPGSSGIYYSNTGTFVFTGNCTLPYNLYQFYNLIVDGGAVVHGGRNLPIEGDLSIINGGSFDIGVYTANRNSIDAGGGGTLTLGAGSTLTIGGGGTIPANFINHSFSSSSTVHFNGVGQTVATLNSSQNYGNIIISGSGIKEINGAIGIAGDLTVNSATFSTSTFTANRTSAGGTLTVANGAILSIGGSGTIPSNFSTHSIGATSTVEYVGTSSSSTAYQTVAILNSSQDYGHLTITGSVKDLAGSVRVRGNLTFGGSPNKLNIGNTTLTIDGNVVNQSTARTFSCSSGSNLVLNDAGTNRTIYFDQTSAATYSINNITFNHSGYITSVSSNLLVNGNLTFTAGKMAIGAARTLTLKGSIVNTVSGGLRGSTTSNLIINTSGAQTLSMDQTTAGSTNAVSQFTINNNSAVVTMDNDLLVNSTMTFTSGKLAINGKTLTLRGNVVNTVTEAIRGGSTSNLVYSGTSFSPSLSFDQTTPGTTNLLNNFTLNCNGRTVSLLNNLRLVGTHTPTAGVLASNGYYTIASTASGTANIATGSTSGGYITGDVTVERFIPQNTNRAWRLLAAPTSGQTIKQAWQESQSAGVDGNPGYGTIITSNSMSWSSAGFDYQTPKNSLLTYDPSTDDMLPVTNTSDPIDGDQGYFIYIRGSRSVTPSSSITSVNSTTLRTKGTLYEGNQSAISVTADQFGMIGNPYASAIDMRNITKSGGCTNTAFYLWDPKLLGSYDIGAFQTLTYSGGNYIIIPGGGSYGSAGSTVNTIQSGAAFLVEASGSSGTIAIPESAKVNGSQQVFRPDNTTSAESMMLTNLYAISGATDKLADGNAVFFGSGYLSAIDGYDSRKQINFSENFSLTRSGTELVIERRPEISAAADTIFYKMYSLKPMSYKLEFMPNAFDAGLMTAYLVDKYLNSQVPVNLTGNTYYTFTVDANAGSFASDRFKLVFRPNAPLAVSFTELKAYQRQQQIAVDWKVNHELNVSRYEVERSADGRNFSKAGSVSATGNNRGAQSYQWMDVRPNQGNNYYRIRSVEVTGDTKYTEIVKVFIGKGQPAISLMNNPVQGSMIGLQLNSQPAGNYFLKLSGVNGQMVQQQQIQFAGGNGSISFQISGSVPNGVYQLEVISADNSRSVHKLIVQR